MIDFPASETTFFLDSENWCSGPVFCITFYGSLDLNESNVFDAILNAQGMLPWDTPVQEMRLMDGKEWLPKRTVVYEALLLPVGIGFNHSFVKREGCGSSYQISIYPPQMWRIFKRDYLTSFELDDVDLGALINFYKILLRIVDSVCTSIEVDWVEVRGEDWPSPPISNWATGSREKGIWIIKAHAKPLGFSGIEIEDWLKLPIPFESVEGTTYAG